MKMSLPPDWLEKVVVGAGIITIISGNHSASLMGVFLLTGLVERISHTWLLSVSNFRPRSNPGMLLGNLLIPMVTATLPSSSTISILPISLHHASAFYLSAVMAVVILIHVTYNWNLGYCSSQLLWLVPPVLGLLVLSFWVDNVVVILLVVIVSLPVIACTILKRILYFLPMSFTLGEVLFISEALTMMTHHAAFSLVSGTRELFGCLQVLILGCVVIFTLVSPVARHHYDCLKHCTEERQPHVQQSSEGRHESRPVPRSTMRLSIYLYVSIASVILFLLLPWLGILIGQEPLMWGLHFVAATRTRMLLVFVWALLVMGAVGVVILQETASTITRKYFHILAVSIFVPGILFDVQLLYLASAGTVFILLNLEFLRILRAWPIGSLLHQAFSIFTNSQDSGVAILTHIYLLVGMSLPVWLYLETTDCRPGVSLVMYSGVLSLGVGDTAASVIGSMYGRIKWPGSKKTLEGTLAAVCSQLIACYLLINPQLSPPIGWGKVTWVVCLTSLLEAVTTQVDNLILPMFMYSLLLTS